MDQNSLFYTCSMIASVAKTTGLKKREVVKYIGTSGIQHIYKFADVFHCQSLEQSTDEIIEIYHIPHQDKESENNNLNVWDSGEVYQRLIEDISNEENWVDKLTEVYSSWLCEYLDDRNLPIYWQPRSYIKECYLQGKIL